MAKKEKGKKDDKADKKKQSKIKENDIKLLLFVFGVMAVAGSHLLVRDPLVLAMETLERDIETATTERDRLVTAKAQLPALMEETEANQIIIENELQKYPEDVLWESFIMYTDTLRNQLNVSVTGVNISPGAQISVAEIMRLQDETDVLMKAASFKTTLNFSFEFTYAQLKSFIEYVHADRERTVVDNITISYNATTGQLTGSTIINKYFIATENYVYTPPDIPLGAVGNSNPFGTLLD